MSFDLESWGEDKVRDREEEGVEETRLDLSLVRHLILSI